MARVNARRHTHRVPPTSGSLLIPAGDRGVILQSDPQSPSRLYGAVMQVLELARRRFDELWAACLALLITTELLFWGPPNVAAVALALGSGLGQVARRRIPLLGFAISWVCLGGLLALTPGFDNNSAGVVVVFFSMHWALGRWTRGRQVYVGAALVVLSMTWFLIGDIGWKIPDPGDVMVTLAFVGGPWAAGLVVHLRRDRETALRAQNEQLQAEQAELARRAVAEERARIARELHDVVSHAISVTVLQARGARATLGRDEGQVRRALDAIEQTNTAALGDMRRLLAVLRDADTEPEPGAELDPQPSLDHLDTLLEHVRDSGVPVELEVSGTRGPVPPGVDLSAYRIVQEALTNVLKHARAARARVCLDYLPDALHLRVVDDGAPAEGPGDGHGPGHGLIGVRERVAVVGGSVTAGPQPDGGYAVDVRLPFSVELS